MKTARTSQKTSLLLAQQFAKYPQVIAVALGGSVSNQASDEKSDIDLVVYCKSARLLPISARQRIIESRDVMRSEINNTFWETGDEWEEKSGETFDVIYRSASWIENEIDKVLVRHEASVGYSTCFWHNVRTSHPLFDSSGWFATLQKKSDCIYPEPLRLAIINKNFPILQDTISSYATQIQKAFIRQDFISVNHRLAAFVASYFDILFALNRQTHPGEKRLLMLAKKQCTMLPKNIDLIQEVLFQDIFKWPKIESKLEQLAREMQDLLNY